MKGKLILFCFVFVLGASGFSSTENTEKVFNPMLPCNVQQHGQSQKLPCSVFGDESGYVDMYQVLSHNNTQYMFYIGDFGADKRNNWECLPERYHFSQGKDQIITAVNSRGGKFFKELGLIVTVDNTRYKDDGQYSVISFFDFDTQELIGKQTVNNTTSGFSMEVLSRRYFTFDNINLWDIKSGWVDCVKDIVGGFSPKTYYRSGNIYNRLNDSFMFRYKKPEFNDFGFLAIQDDDFIFLSRDVSIDKKFRIGEIVKLDFRGEVVKRWKTDFFEPYMDSFHCMYIRDNQAMIYCESKKSPRNYRLFNLDTGEVVWNFGLTAEMNGRFNFENGIFYTQSSYLAARVKPDGTKTYVYFPGNPQYITLDNNLYYLKGIPSSDPDNLQCRLVRLEKNKQIETDLIVQASPNYSINSNTVVGWTKQDIAVKNKKLYQPYKYCIQKLTETGFSVPIFKTVEFPNEADISLDFENLKAAQFISPDKVIITNLENKSEKELNTFGPNDTYRNHSVRSIIIRGNLLALYKLYYETDDVVDYVDIYDLGKSKWVLHDKVPKAKLYTRLNLMLEGSRQSKNLCFAGNTLIAWRDDSTYIELINLIEMTSVRADSTTAVQYINDRLYCKSGLKFIILNPSTLEQKTYDIKYCRFEPLFNLWLEEYGPNQIYKGGLLPQRYMGIAYSHRIGDWYSKYPFSSYDGDFVKLESCPTFSIKRTSNNEFQIKNTSPNCDTPLNANVYLVTWSDDWCPAYWQARNVVGKVENQKLDEQSIIKIPDIDLIRSGRFALVIESNGLLDTSNSELSDFDKGGRPLFDGIPISCSLQKSVVVTVWDK